MFFGFGKLAKIPPGAGLGFRAAGALLPWALLAAVATGFPGPLVAQGRLVLREMALERRPELVRVVDWAGRPAVMVVLPPAGGQGELPRGELLVTRLENGTLRVDARWPLPADLRWIEPLHFGPGQSGWLALIGAGWYAGRLAGGGPRWELLCGCETLFSAGRKFLPFTAGFVSDLDGDGVSEVLLPHGLGLNVFRLPPRGGKLQLMWRVAWEVYERYSTRDLGVTLTLALPRNLLRDVDGDGVLDFVQIGENQLWTALQPRPAAPRQQPYYVLDAETLRRMQQVELPPLVLQGLRRMNPASFPSWEAFLAAVRPQLENPGQLSGALLERMETAARAPTPVLFPRPVPLPSLEKAPREKARIHTVEDMNGDGALDVIYVKSTDPDSLLDQKNQLRWFQGRRKDGGLEFPEKPGIFFSEGPALAELIYPRRDGAGGPALFLATTEVTLLALIRALTVGTASLDLYVYPWRAGKLVVPPPYRGSFSFRLRAGGRPNRPMVLLADLNGDGWREYLFNMELDTLTAFAGGPNGPGFDAEPLVRAQVALPQKPDTVFVRDLDGNGREELVLWHVDRKQPPPLGRTLRVLEFVPGK